MSITLTAAGTMYIPVTCAILRQSSLHALVTVTEGMLHWQNSA